MTPNTSNSNDQSFSLDKGLIDPMAEHQQRIDDFLDNKKEETTVRYLNKKKISKLWKVLTSNII